MVFLDPEAAQYEDEVPFDKLYSALIECFGVILCGYIAGRLGFVTEQQSSGLATFVGTFSLPSLIFLSLATLDISAVSWYFVLSVLISKAIVFLSVLFITLLVTRPVALGEAGLYAIFCTQSNDFAIGYPIVTTVYGPDHPFVSYLYLLAPVNLVMLNPIGFVLMEINKRRGSASRVRLPLVAFSSIVTNPIVMMTLLGVIGNFVFKGNVPDALYALLDVFGSAFTATALFLLGLRMVGSVRNFKGEALLVPICLIAAKELMLPVVTREVSSLILNWSKANSSASTALSTFGFLYGTIPAAPGVFVYANTYALEANLIATAMVACTFVSAPLMFISAKMVFISHMSQDIMMQALLKFETDLSIVGIFACALLLAVFSLKRSNWSVTHKITTCIILSQLVGCLGVLAGHLESPAPTAPPLSPINLRLSTGLGAIRFFTVSFSDFSSRIWTACLAIALALLESRNYASVNSMFPAFVGVAWGFPIFLILTILLATHFSAYRQNNEPLVEIVNIFLLLVCFTVSLVYLVLQQRYKKRHARYLDYSREANAESEVIPSGEHTSLDNDQEPVLPVDSSESSRPGDIDIQRVHHLALAVSLVCSIFVDLALGIWHAIDDEITGVYVELEFLGSFLIRGQIFIVLFIFGLDSIALLQPLFKRFMEIFHNSEPITLPNVEDLPTETQHLCHQFNTYHIQPCQAQIVRRRRLKLWDFVSSFTGEDLVNWLLTQGLIKDREEGLVYGSHLLSGRVIRHVNNTQYFTDDSSLFVFEGN